MGNQARRGRHIVVSALALTLCVTFGAESSASQPRPPIEQQSEILDIFTNRFGDQVLYRRGYYGGGSRGFGYEKATKKHGVTNNAVVGAVVRSPQEVREEDEYWIHEKEAILYGFFTESQSLTVRVVINYGNWEGAGQHGVVTAYCVGYLVCPEWVNTAFSID